MTQSIANEEKTPSAELADLRRLADPEFLAERRRVREALESAPEQSPDRGSLATRYAALNAEFDRRASRAWAAGS